MQTYSTFLDRKNFQNRLKDSINDIDSIYSRIDNALNENLYPLDKNSYHFLGQLLKNIAPDNRSARVISAYLFKAAYQAEIVSAGGANIAFLFGLQFAKEMIKENLSESNAIELYKNIDNHIDNLKKQLEKNSKVPSEEDLKKSIKDICSGNPSLYQSVCEALDLAGLEGKVFIENGKQENYIVELKEGYNFKLKPFKFMLKNNGWDQRNCKVLIIDGLVEKVSEIDHLLNKTLETKIPMTIIAHGFSEEVAATLKANQDRGLFDIQAVRIPSDIDNLNIANDISVVCGTTPVSSMKGDLIVFVNYDDIPTVDRVRLKENECTIENPKTRNAVAEQTKSILEKRQTYFLHEEVQELFDKRMRSLVSNAVTIHLPNMAPAKIDDERVKIDLSLRQAKTILNYGMIDVVSELQNWNKTLNPNPSLDVDFDKILSTSINNTIEKVKTENIKVVPTMSMLIGIKFSAQAMLRLMTSSGFVSITY